MWRSTPRSWSSGILERWEPHRKPARYLYPGDGWRYWSMSARRSDREGRHPLEISRHINRHRIEEAQKLRTLVRH
jgi:hypothetical protein